MSFIRNWAVRFNLKEASKTLIYLQEKGIVSYEDLTRKIDAASSAYRAFSERIKAVENRMNEIKELQKHITGYKRTLDVYSGYKEVSMRGLNIIWVFDQAAKKVLMCKRRKEPYKGLYNLVGGKIEQNEDGLSAAYRELKEETNITEINLTHLMDFTYFLSDSCCLEVYVGRLCRDIDVYGDEKELVWIDTRENFFDMSRFAGEGNIGHIFEIIKQNRLDGKT